MKDQLEWRDLTEECKPELDQNVQVWFEESLTPDMMWLENGQENMPFMCFLNCPPVLLFGGHSSVKWKNLDSNPWENKQ